MVLLLLSGLAVWLAVRSDSGGVFKVILFVPVVGFILWAVLTEKSEWEGDEARVLRKRARRRRLRFGKRDPIRSTRPASADVKLQRTRDRGPEGRRRRLRRHMNNPLAVTVFLLCIAVILLICFLRGCARWPLFG